MEKLRGPFKDIIPILVDMKKSTGYKYNNIKKYCELDNFLYNQKITKLDKEIFNLAIKKEKNEYLKKNRYYILENLNVILSLIGLKEIPMEKIHMEKNEKFIARVLTKKEINILFKKIDSESLKYKDNRKIIFPVLFRLIYSTGLRINEALSLINSDYCPKNGVLLIRTSKNNITRNVVLRTSMKKIFEKYLGNLNLSKDDKIFNISYSIVRNFFHENIIKLSLEPCRIHDLRHTFAVHSLEKLLKNMEEDKALYYLSVFMGHTNIESTSYYIHLTNKYINNIRRQTKDTSIYIFPEVNDGE